MSMCSFAFLPLFSITREFRDQLTTLPRTPLLELTPRPSSLAEQIQFACSASFVKRPRTRCCRVLTSRGTGVGFPIESSDWLRDVMLLDHTKALRTCRSFLARVKPVRRTRAKVRSRHWCSTSQQLRATKSEVQEVCLWQAAELL